METSNMGDAFAQPPAKKSKTLHILNWIIVFLLVFSIGVPVASLLLGGALQSMYLGTIATVFALSGITLIGGLLAALLAVIAFIMEIRFVQKNNKPLLNAVRTPSGIVLILLILGVLYISLA